MKRKFPMLDLKTDAGDLAPMGDHLVAFGRAIDHNPDLPAGKHYVLKHKSSELYYASSPIVDTPLHFTQKPEEARRHTAEYLNRTCWDWSLECDTVEVSHSSGPIEK